VEQRRAEDAAGGGVDRLDPIALPPLDAPAGTEAPDMATPFQPPTASAARVARRLLWWIGAVARVQFAGAYADNLNWGMEAATRSANRVALAIDQA